MSYSLAYTNNVRFGLKEKGQAGSAVTGTMAAALAADASVWTLRYSEVTAPNPPSVFAKKLYVQRISLTFTTIVAFTTPVTADRRLKLVRGAPTTTAVDPSGGAAYSLVRKRSDLTADVEKLAIGRVATTAALTTTGFTFETAPLRSLLLVAAGASGGAATATWSFDGLDADPVFLLPGQVLAIQAGALFDAAGTWQLVVDVDCCEVP